MEDKSPVNTLAAPAEEWDDDKKQKGLFQSVSTNEEYNDPPSTEPEASAPDGFKSEKIQPGPKINTTRSDLVSEVRLLGKELRQKLKMLDSMEQSSDLDGINQLPKVKDETGLDNQTATTSENLDKTARKLIRRARFAQKYAKRVEEDSVREKSLHRERLPGDSMLRVRQNAVSRQDLAQLLNPDLQAQKDYTSSDMRESRIYLDNIRKDTVLLTPASLRPVYSRRLGPPNQWDTSDSEEWSTDTSTKSQDFDYFRARLRADFEWELDRLLAQRKRYQKHKEKRGKIRQKAKGENSASLVDEKFALPQLSFLKWADFIGARVSLPEVSPAIDILVGDPEVSSNYFRHLYNRREQGKPIGISTTKLESVTGQEPLPDRIRIRSKPLMKILSFIRGSDLGGNDCLSSVMLRPFKMLCHYEDDLRRRHEELKNRLTSKANLASEVTSTVQNVDGSNNVRLQLESKPGDPEIEGQGTGEESRVVEDSKGYNSSEIGLQHLECLLEFMDTHISRKYTYLKSVNCDKVTFSDLWHLYKPGDFVISTDGKQAYQVAGVTSAPHDGNAKSTHRWKSPRFKYELDSDSVEQDQDQEPLSIHCVYIHFDGSWLGPVVKSFDIDRFEGERSIVSFAVYPLRFHAMKELSRRVGTMKSEICGSNLIALEDEVTARVKYLRNSLIQRGKMFVDVVGIKHMYYSGVTVDTRDEVESQVVIDFQEAFSQTDLMRWRPNISSLIGPNVNENLRLGERRRRRKRQNRELNEDGCSTCCAGEHVIDDTYVENDRHLNFVRDTLALREETPQKLPSTIIYPRSLEDVKADRNDFTDNELLIMSYSVFGFALRDRTWAQLDLAYLTEVTPIGNDYTTSDNANEDESAFNRLVLDQKIKDMVLSLIAQHFRNKESQQNADEQLDIVRGKGKGLIILLHGAPGVGKTTTAEGVAERFNKPLFQITCGDLGSTAKEVEDALSINFSLANRWGCILLLDEADVFLASRRREDFTRNGLVAVFLRVLEYYAGILFLTTNRIGDFDEAFASRIHMSLYYPPLDEIATNRIFKLNFDLIRDRYKKNGRLIDIDDSGIYSFVTKFWMENQQARWNGRQIRNACQTALALAEFEALPNDKRFDLKFKSKAKVHLKRSNIETVSDAYLEFIKYLKAVHGTDQETHAKELGIRAMEKVFDSMMNERVSRGGNPVPQERTQNQNPLRSFRIPDRSPPATQTYPSFEQHREAPYNSPGPAYRNPSPSSGAGYSSHGYQPDNPFLQAPHASHASSGYGATQQYPRHTQSASTEGPSAYPPGPSQPQYYHQGQGSGMTNDPRFAQSVPGQGARPQYQGWRSEAYPVAGQEITETTGVNLTSIPVSYSTEDPNIQHSASSNSQ